MLVFHDDAAAQETEAAHHAGRNPGRVEPVRPGEAILGNDHEQAGAQGHQDMGPNPGALPPEFPFVTDDRPDHPGGDQPDAKFQCKCHNVQI